MSVVTATRPVSITPMTGAVGASVSGLDVRAEYSAEIQETLVRALHEHGVLFVRFEGEIEPEDHRRLGRVFGELSPFKESAHPFVGVVDSETKEKYSPQRWHTDATIFAEPPRAAALRAITLPRIGGDTLWASMYAAYEALSSKMQRFLEGLEALHSNDTRMRTISDEPFERRTAVHPVVIRDPVTGKPALYVHGNNTERILGLSDQESAGVLAMLFAHMNTPDFHVRLKWDTQTIAVWEERVTQHRAVADYTGRRIMHRVLVKGDTPAAYGEITS
jgi:taurine dioxygenase